MTKWNLLYELFNIRKLIFGTQHISKKQKT